MKYFALFFLLFFVGVNNADNSNKEYKSRQTIIDMQNYNYKDQIIKTHDIILFKKIVDTLMNLTFTPEIKWACTEYEKNLENGTWLYNLENVDDLKKENMPELLKEKLNQFLPLLEAKSAIQWICENLYKMDDYLQQFFKNSFNLPKIPKDWDYNEEYLQSLF